jgi:hypothetical protein
MLTSVRHALAIGATAFLLAGPAAAAPTQGTFGATSTGSVGITASVPGRVRISGLTDISFSSVDPTLTAKDAQNVCVWSNTSTRGYSITATGSGTANAFTLSSATLADVPYTVEWSSLKDQTAGTGLAAGTKLAGQTSTATNSDCTAGTAKTASLIVAMAPATLDTMTAGASYTGSLTLLVAPE